MEDEAQAMPGEVRTIIVFNAILIFILVVIPVAAMFPGDNRVAEKLSGRGIGASRLSIFAQSTLAFNSQSTKPSRSHRMV